MLNHVHFYLRQGSLISFDNNIRVEQYKVPVIKRDMTNNSQPVGNNAKLENIAEMTVDI